MAFEGGSHLHSSSVWEGGNCNDHVSFVCVPGCALLDAIATLPGSGHVSLVGKSAILSLVCRPYPRH